MHKLYEKSNKVSRRPFVYLAVIALVVGSFYTLFFTNIGIIYSVKKEIPGASDKPIWISETHYECQFTDSKFMTIAEINRNWDFSWCLNGSYRVRYDGRLLLSGEYLYGSMDGYWQKYYPSGKKMFQVCFSKGRKSGEAKYYDNNNIIASVIFNSKSNIVEGILYNSNGQIKAKGNYSNSSGNGFLPGLRVGKWRVYDREGNKLCLVDQGKNGILKIDKVWSKDGEVLDDAFVKTLINRIGSAEDYIYYDRFSVYSDILFAIE